MTASIDSRFGLADALSVGPGDVVSLVGAGGKTTTLYGLVAELRKRGLSAIATTTTHLQSPDADPPAYTTPPLVFASQENNWLETVRQRVARYGSATVVGTRVREDKLKGLGPREVDMLRQMADVVVIEADGARGRSLKAPAAHEPAIPPSTTATVVLCALDALGKPLDDQTVHRLDEVLKLTGAQPGDTISPELLTLAIFRGYASRIPPSSRRTFFLNKADDGRLKLAERVGQLLVALGATEVVFGEARNPHACYYVMKARGKAVKA